MAEGVPDICRCAYNNKHAAKIVNILLDTGLSHDGYNNVKVMKEADERTNIYVSVNCRFVRNLCHLVMVPAELDLMALMAKKEKKIKYNR